MDTSFEILRDHFGSGLSSIDLHPARWSNGRRAHRYALPAAILGLSDEQILALRSRLETVASGDPKTKSSTAALSSAVVYRQIEEVNPLAFRLTLEPRICLAKRMLLILDRISIRDPWLDYTGFSYAEYMPDSYIAEEVRHQLATTLQVLAALEPLIENGLVQLVGGNPVYSGLDEVGQQVEEVRPNPGTIPYSEGFGDFLYAQNDMAWALATAINSDSDLVCPDLSDGFFSDSRLPFAERAMGMRLPNVQLMATSDFLAMRSDAESFSLIRRAFKNALQSVPEENSDAPRLLLGALDDELLAAQRILDSDFRSVGLDIRLAPLVGAAVVTTDLLSSGGASATSVIGGLIAGLPASAEWLRRKRLRRLTSPTARVILALRFPQSKSG